MPFSNSATRPSRAFRTGSCSGWSRIQIGPADAALIGATVGATVGWTAGAAVGAAAAGALVAAIVGAAAGVSLPPHATAAIPTSPAPRKPRRVCLIAPSFFLCHPSGHPTPKRMRQYTRVHSQAQCADIKDDHGGKTVNTYENLVSELVATFGSVPTINGHTHVISETDRLARDLDALSYFAHPYPAADLRSAGMRTRTSCLSRATKET